MKVEKIKSLSDAQNFIEGVINDFEEGISTKAETMESMREYTDRLMELNRQKLIKFFIWFRKNGEKHLDKTIEGMIDFYLKNIK